MTEWGIDLHMHTRCSDGCFSPSELVEQCARHGIYTMSITDHDTVAGLEEGIAAACRQGIALITGLELTAEFEGELHILGYGIDPSAQQLTDFLDKQLKLRDARNRKMVKRLQVLGIGISHEELVESSGLEIYGRTQMAQMLTEKGYAASGDEAFQRWVGHSCPAYVPREKPSYTDCIRIIHSAGGLAVWAHPVLTKLDLSEQKALLESMLSDGLDGIETFYTYHDREQTEFCLRAAERYDILPTCGSDFHGGGVHIEATLDTYKQFNLPVSAVKRLRNLAISFGD